MTWKPNESHIRNAKENPLNEVILSMEHLNLLPPFSEGRAQVLITSATFSQAL